jgi:hypothetical protein
MDAIEWVREVERLGAGEILLTSMDADGTKNGYDIELTRLVCEQVRNPSSRRRLGSFRTSPRYLKRREPTRRWRPPFSISASLRFPR